MKKYFDILGISPTASETDIKKAFKEKAKLLHPDRNNSPTAHEEFLALYEAFNSILHNLQHNSVNKTIRVSPQQQRKKQREQAIRFAQMRYEAWTKTKEYKDLSNINTIQEFITSVLILFIIVSIFGILGKITELKYGAIAGLSTGLILSYSIIKNNTFGISLRIAPLCKAISELISFKTGMLVVISILNIVVFFNIGLNTLLPLQWLGCSYLLSFILFQWFVFFIFKIKKQFIQKIILSSTLLSFLLCLNFFFSSNPTSKTYAVQNMQEDNLLELENNSLKEFVGVRFFSEIDNLALLKSIEFTFEKGMFGIDVVKDIKFNRYLEPK